MARKQKLKVYRTPIGFHDAYVAATSQKDALKAWGSDVNLFARGIAEIVTDEALTREPLDKPGIVIRRPRGTNDEYMAALPKDGPPPSKRPPSRNDDTGPPPRRRRTIKTDRSARHRVEAPQPATTRAPAETESKGDARPRMKPRAKPRPSRDELDEAEKALENTQADHEARIAELRRRERDLQTERRTLEADHEREVTNLETALADVRDRYGEALQKWRGD